jgi:hypothetical protein
VTAIDDKHALLRATVVDLGEPIGPEVPVGDGGSIRSYEHGTICAHPEIGAFEVHGLIGETYLTEFGGPSGRLGFPTSDEQRVGVGFLSTFELHESGLFFDPLSGMHHFDDAGARGMAELVSDEIGATPPFGAGTQRLCFPPGMVVGALKGMQFGLIAERLIHDDYCSVMGCDPTHDYFDRTGSNVEYLTFLQSHNPGLRPRYRQLRRWKRPDILTDNPPRKEWYEIKPLSVDGMVAFGLKYQGITTYIAEHSLPYVPGVTYTPTPFIAIGAFPINGIVLNASLGVARRTAGLVDYQLCVQGDLVSVLATIALAALVAALLDAIVAAMAAAVVA